LFNGLAWQGSLTAPTTGKQPREKNHDERNRVLPHDPSLSPLP
jgi:hypothetical protein